MNNYVVDHIEDVIKLINAVYSHKVKPILLRYSNSIQKNVLLSEEDIKQSMIIKILRVSDTYNPNESKLSSWVYAVGMHEAIWLLRSQVRFKRQPLAPTLYLDDFMSEIIPDNSLLLDEQYVDLEIKKRVVKLFNEIQDINEKNVLLKYVCAGKTLRETGDELGYSPESVRQIKDRAIRRLRKELKTEGFYDEKTLDDLCGKKRDRRKVKHDN